MRPIRIVSSRPRPCGATQGRGILRRLETHFPRVVRYVQLSNTHACCHHRQVHGEPAGPVCRANGLYSSLPSLSMGIVGLIEPGCQSKDKRSDLSPAETEAEWIVVRKRHIRKRDWIVS